MCIENALFLEDLNILCSMDISNDVSGSISPLNELAVMIFKKYIVVGSYLELNISCALRSSIEIDIKSGRFDKNVFEEVKDQVELTIYENTFRRFIVNQEECNVI